MNRIDLECTFSQDLISANQTQLFIRASVKALELMSTLPRLLEVNFKILSYPSMVFFLLLATPLLLAAATLQDADAAAQVRSS